MSSSYYVNDSQIDPGEQSRFELYSGMINSMNLGSEEAFITEPLWLYQLGTSIQAKDRSLFPRLQELHLDPSWSSAPSCPSLLFFILSPATKTLKIEFGKNPSFSYLLQFVDVIPHSASSLRKLTLTCTNSVPQGPVNSDEPPFTMQSLASSFARLTSVEALQIEPSLMTSEILEAIGTLPRLRSLGLYSSAPLSEVVFPIGNLMPNPNLFTELEELVIKTSLPLLDRILSSYFAGPDKSKSLTRLEAELSDVTMSPQYFESLAIPTLQDLTLQFFKLSATSISMRCLLPLDSCSDLRKLNIRHAEHLSLNTDQFSSFIGFCSNLKTLHLVVGRKEWRAQGFAGQLPGDVRTRERSGPDLSTLGYIARNLLQLEYLALSVSASYTFILEEDQDLVAFKSLKQLVLLHSFLNWEVTGFKLFEATRYLSLLLPPHAQFGTSRLDSEKFTQEAWQKFVNDHTKFIKGLEQRLEEDRKIRLGQTLYLQAQLGLAAAA